MNFTWRPLLKDDIEFINEFHSKLISKNKLNGISKYVTSKDLLLGDTLDELCLSADSIIKSQVALDGDTFVGLIIYNIDIVQDKKILELEGMVVHPDMTGRGIGKRMLNDLINNTLVIFDREVSLIRAIVEKDNIASQKIFDTNKFHRKDRNKTADDKYIAYDLEV